MTTKDSNNLDDQNDHNALNEPTGVYHTQGPLSFEHVWQMFQESDKMFQKYREENREAFRASREQMREAFNKTDQEFKEITKKFRETDKKIKEAFELFTGQWGRLVESLVEGDLPRVMQERGVMVTQTIQRAKSLNDKAYEFDILALNGNVCVVVEVKTTLRPKDVEHFLFKLKHFREWMPGFAAIDRVLGAVAYLRVNSNSDKMAEKNGLFTIRATGKSAKIVNTEDFQPQQF